MSEENVELVRRLLDMFANRDHEGVFAFYDPEIEWDATHLRAAGLDDLGGVYRGHDGVRIGDAGSGLERPRVPSAGTGSCSRFAAARSFAGAVFETSSRLSRRPGLEG